MEKVTTYNMKHFSFIVCAFIYFTTSYAQNGIEIGGDKAHVQIAAIDTGIPALKMDNQVVPHGEIDGQMAVIEGILYTYVSRMDKWLSVETTMFTFALLGVANNEPLEYIGDVEQGGPLLPMDATVVAVTGSASGGNWNKQLEIEVSSPFGATPAFSVPIYLVNGRILDTAIQRADHVPAGIWAKVRVTQFGTDGVTPNGNVNDPMFTLWVKWRKDNPPAN